MKVAIIANVSANGKVLLAENPGHQAPPEAMYIFMQMAGQAGNLIIGKNTFEMFRQIPGGINGFLPGVTLVVLSATAPATEAYPVVRSAEEAIAYLAAKGFERVVVGGGTKTYNAFLDKDLVTDIHFNLLPLITGSGGILGTNIDLNSAFKLANQKSLADGIVQLHWTKP